MWFTNDCKSGMSENIEPWESELWKVNMYLGQYDLKFTVSFVITPSLLSTTDVVTSYVIWYLK